MSNFKKLSAVLLAVIMLLAVATTAFAEETVTNATTHTYDVYQIFEGTQSATDTTGKLAVSDWGDGIDSTAFLAALKSSTKFGTPNIFASATTAKDVADALCNATAEQARAFGDLASGYLTSTKAAEGVTGGTVTLDAGYYLVVDTTNVNGTADAKNVSLLQVTKRGTFEIQKKYDVPEVEKKVKDINDTTDTTVGTWQDSADYDIGDVIDFQLKGTLPTNYADYETYFYQFNDTLDEGLTYNNDATVYVVNGTTETEVTGKFTMDDAIATIKCDNLKAITEGDDATPVTIDKDSKIVVRYSATLNTKAVAGTAGNKNTVTVTYSNNPNTNGGGDKGTTPGDTVVVFTYKVIVNKVNEEGTALSGAVFTLFKKMQDETLTEIAVIDGNDDEAIDGDTTSFAFAGLDDGTYVLKETTSPAGYNGIADVEFTITAAHNDGATPSLTSLTGTGITFTADVANGTLTTDVVNKSGYVLPETGGLGTTLFYVFGAILAIGAGVLLVAQKRMSSSEE